MGVALTGGGRVGLAHGRAAEDERGRPKGGNRMKAKELRELTVEELRRKAKELAENQFNLRIRHRTGQLDSSADLGRNRKDLARVLTVLAEKDRAAVKAQAAGQEK